MPPFTAAIPSEGRGYPDAGAVRSVIKDAASKASKVDPNVRVDERIRQAHFDRSLCRIFSEGDGSEWVLKGGTGVLARVADGRANSSTCPPADMAFRPCSVSLGASATFVPSLGRDGTMRDLDQGAA